jgi:hypothetical protein
MHRMTRAIGAIACLSLLILQLSGAHVHIGAAGYVGAPEASYSHDHGVHDHDHAPRFEEAAIDHGADARSAFGDDYEDAQDVSLLDQTLTAFKIPIAVLALVVLFVALQRAHTLASADIVYPVLSGRHTRWRPPLRAPPRPA